MSWLDGGSSGSPVDVHGILADEQLVKGLASIVDAGALLSLGTTSDGGALSITVTVDGRFRREYVRSADEMQAWLAEAVPGIEDELAKGGGRNGQPRASAAPRRRTRRS